MRMALWTAALACVCASSPLAAVEEGEDWRTTLAEAEAAGATEAADTGIVGLSADELAALAGEESAEAADEEVPEDFIRNRRRFVMREMKFNADWDTDPTAVPAFVYQFQRRTGMDAQALQPRKPLTFDDPELLDWPMVYMTAHHAFTLSDAETAGLRKFLDRGGFVFSDDCLYGMPYGPAFHGEIKKALPEGDFKPLNDKVDGVSMLLKQKYAWTHVSETGLPMKLGNNPFEYVLVHGHLGVLYTPPDLGCMWEISSPPTPSNPLGAGMHNMDMEAGKREDAYRIGVNVILYVMTH